MTASAPHDIAESSQKGIKIILIYILFSTIHIDAYARTQANKRVQIDPDTFSNTMLPSFLQPWVDPIIFFLNPDSSKKIIFP